MSCRRSAACVQGDAESMQLQLLAVLLCTVKDTPGINYNHVILETPVRGRYARFCSSAEGYAEVAEMHFYKGEEEIVPIDSWGRKWAGAGKAACVWRKKDPGKVLKIFCVSGFRKNLELNGQTMLALSPGLW